MKLLQLEIEGYRSIRERVVLHVDEYVTVLLGANDHGKTNLLSAIRHFNTDHGFDPDLDLNLDLGDEPASYPSIKYVLELTAAEHTDITNELKRHAELTHARESREAWQSTIASCEDELNEAAIRLGKAEADLSAMYSQAASESSTESDIRGANDQVGSAQRDADEAQRRLDEARQYATVGAALEMRAEKADGLQSALSEAQDRLIALQGRQDAVSKEYDDAGAGQIDAVATHGDGTEQATLARARLDSAKQDVDALMGEVESVEREIARLETAEKLLAEFDSGEIAPPPIGQPALGRDHAEVSVPNKVTFERTGLEGALRPVNVGALGARAMELVGPLLPSVELIVAQDSIADSVTRESINDPDNDFMRGIFQYAGLRPADWDGLFDQDMKTTMRLDRANDVLNERLRESWSQGRELNFKLDHNVGAIDLQIRDPAVSNQYVRASRRSSGFTHFFALKTALYARRVR